MELREEFGLIDECRLKIGECPSAFKAKNQGLDLVPGVKSVLD